MNRANLPDHPTPAPSRSIAAVAGVSWWWLASAGAAALALGVALIGGIYLLAKPLALLLLGASVAAALSPLVHRLEPRLPRKAAILLIYLALALLLAGVAAAVLPILISQAEEIGRRAPELRTRLDQALSSSAVLRGVNLSERIGSSVGDLSAGLLALPMTAASSMLDILFVVFVSLYWLIQAPSMHRFFLSLFPRERQSRVDSILHEMGSSMGGFVRATALTGLVVGVITYIGLIILGVPYAVVLALFAGILEMVPTFGPLISGVLMIGTALTQSPTQALLVAAFAVALQLFENYILVPNLMRAQTAVSPLLVILAIVGGSAVGGLWGILAAVPLMAALTVFARRVVAPAIRRRTGAEVTDAETDNGEAAHA